MGNQFRIGRDSLTLFGHIQVTVKGFVSVLDIQIIVEVIVNKIETADGALSARWISVGDPKYSSV